MNFHVTYITPQCFVSYFLDISLLTGRAQDDSPPVLSDGHPLCVWNILGWVFALFGKFTGTPILCLCGVQSKKTLCDLVVCPFASEWVRHSFACAGHRKLTNK